MNVKETDSGNKKIFLRAKHKTPGLDCFIGKFY